MNKNSRRHGSNSTACSEKNKEAIAFIDSGVGGLPYLKSVREQLPYENYIYFADIAHFPYGEKPLRTIEKTVHSAVESLLRVEDPKIIVIACNTASVVALSSLRRRFNKLFVGVVPAVKPAAIDSRKKRIGVLATGVTVNNGYLHNLIDNFASDCFVKRIGGKDLVRFVEYDLPEVDEYERIHILSSIAQKFKEANVDKVVLGCTHFLYVEKELQTLLGPNIDLVDSREGVTSRIVELAKELRNQHKSFGFSKLYISGSPPLRKSISYFMDRFGLTFAGYLN